MTRHNPIRRIGGRPGPSDLVSQTDHGSPNSALRPENRSFVGDLPTPPVYPPPSWSSHEHADASMGACVRVSNKGNHLTDTAPGSRRLAYTVDSRSFWAEVSVNPGGSCV